MQHFPDAPADRPSTTIVHRPFAGLTGFRRISDRASRVAVLAFPVGMINQLSGLGVLPSSGAYIIADDRSAYLGESVRLPRRLAEHASDPAKDHFARDVYVVASSDESAPFDKVFVLDLQHRLTRRTLDAALVTVVAGVGPIDLDLSGPDRSTNDLLFADALRLLHDAGAWFLQPSAPEAVPAREAGLQDDVSDPADEGPMVIGVSTIPLGAEEYEMSYDNIWARGYWSSGRFVVAAGSEIRVSTNSSCNSATRARREDLFRSGALAPIPGLSDRRRLVQAVAFASSSIAAKTTCGAHTTPRWIPLPPSQVVILEALRQSGGVAPVQL